MTAYMHLSSVHVNSKICSFALITRGKKKKKGAGRRKLNLPQYEAYGG